jgi:hypothetical protein
MACAEANIAKTELLTYNIQGITEQPSALYKAALLLVYVTQSSLQDWHIAFQ